MSDATGLMGFWSDIDADYVTEFRRWHNCEHMAERVGIPGFLAGRRYCGNGDAAMFLMYYEAETPGVLGGEAYHAALNSPTPWTREALKHFRNPSRNIYRLIASEGAPPARATPYLATMRFNLSGNDDAIIADYRASVLPGLASHADIARARLWEIDAAISGMDTSERRIYGGGPGQQRYLLFVELNTELAPFAPAALPGLTAGQAAQHVNVFSETGWLDFALENNHDA